MAILEDIAISVEKGDETSVGELTQKAITEGIEATEILNKGLVAGMNVVGEKFKNNEVFIPEVLVSARAMKAGMKQVRPLLAEANIKSKGKIVVGTVKGDLHDIGKNIVGMLLEGAGFEVTDLGTDVSKEEFMDVVEKEGIDVIGMSALLTTTMTYMKEIIQAVNDANLKDKVKVIIGGAPITQSYADEIKADGYAPDAASAVDLVKSLLNS
ncbi:MAG: corrinoid protein [Candidatus Aminicenantes bacterium]|nr:corrinoid protein [Candidatus Aminicenantes bacterium]